MEMTVDSFLHTGVIKLKVQEKSKAFDVYLYIKMFLGIKFSFHYFFYLDAIK